LTQMASSISTHKKEPWQRFTVLDALLLQAGYALAFSVVLSPYRRLALGSFDEGAVLILLLTFCLGSTFSGPIILGSHWLIRGRRVGMSAGEWLWLSPFGILLVSALGVWALHWVAQILPDPDEIRAVFFALLALIMFLVEVGCMLNALLVVVARSVGDLTDPPCWWTDRFGTLTCLTIGAIVVLSVLAVLS
jgi:cation transport ATPase